MPVTITDIAKAIGVGRTTVSRALRGEGYVSKQKKAKILAIARQMGYQPNNLARSLVLGQTRLVGFMVTFNLGALQTVVEPIERALRKAGYPVLLHSPADSVEAQTLCLEQFMQNRVAGVIAFPGVSTSSTEPYLQLIKNDVKLVILDRKFPDLPVPQIVVNNYKIARTATEHLISLGHRRIVHLAMPETSEPGQERARGFRDALAAAHIPITPSSTITTKLNGEDGAKVMSELLKRRPLPTAVVARHDLVATSAMHSIFAAGLSVPEDISVVGTGDIWDSLLLKVPLTTIHYSTEKMARIGAKWLIDMLQGKTVEPQILTLDARLVVRSSTAPPPAD